MCRWWQGVCGGGVRAGKEVGAGGSVVWFREEVLLGVVVVVGVHAAVVVIVLQR